MLGTTQVVIELEIEELEFELEDMLHDFERGLISYDAAREMLLYLSGEIADRRIALQE